MKGDTRRNANGVVFRENEPTADIRFNQEQNHRVHHGKINPGAEHGLLDMAVKRNYPRLRKVQHKERKETQALRNQHAAHGVDATSQEPYTREIAGVP